LDYEKNRKNDINGTLNGTLNGDRPSKSYGCFFFSRVVLDAQHPVHCCEIQHQFVDGFFHYHYNLIVQYVSQCFIGVPIVTLPGAGFFNHPQYDQTQKHTIQMPSIWWSPWLLGSEFQDHHRWLGRGDF